MAARVPLDVDLEDKLLYGLTPARLGYLVLALLAGFSTWSGHWARMEVRGATAILIALIGVVAAWGRWRGRATEGWVTDFFIFLVANYRVLWRQKN